MGRILVVDDSQAMRHFVAAGLATAFDVEIAEDGEAALARLVDGGFDAVVSDIEMPRLGGVELVKTLRDSGTQIPILLLTDADIDAYLPMALRLGLGHIFPKQMLNLGFEGLICTLSDLIYPREGGLSSFLSPGGEVRTFVLRGLAEEEEGLGQKIFPILDHFPRAEIYRAVFSLLLQQAIVGDRSVTVPNPYLQVAVGGDRTRVGLSIRSPMGEWTRDEALGWFAGTQSAGSLGWALQMVRRFMDQCHVYLSGGAMEVVCIDLLDGYEGPRPLSIFGL